MQEYEKNNFNELQKEIENFKREFTFDDAVNSWNKQRKFKFRTVQKFISLPPKENEFVGTSLIIHKFEVLQNNKQFLFENGFYRRYLDYDLDWQQTDFYRNLFDDFFEQYVINGDSAYGYYIFGDVGVGKTTLLTSIAKVLVFFLEIKVRYITMPRLVKIITSIKETDKEKLFELENCDVLFIDDLAHEELTTSNQEAVVRNFFAYRYGNGLVNIVAGNIDIRTQSENNSFNRQMADYLNDSKYYKIAEMEGESKRL